MKSFGDKAPSGKEVFGGGMILPFLDVNAKPRGFVEINKLQDGILVEQIMAGYTPVNENLVVNLARSIMSRLLSGAAQWDDGGTPANPVITLTDTGHPSYPQAEITDPSELYITNMRFGTGGHDPLNPATPVDPTPDDERLAAPLTAPSYKPCIIDYPDNTTVRFTATLEQSEANGETISEIGLFTDSHDLLFSRKTFGILTKSSDFAFEMRYSILM